MVGPCSRPLARPSLCPTQASLVEVQIIPREWKCFHAQRASTDYLSVLVLVRSVFCGDSFVGACTPPRPWQLLVRMERRGAPFRLLLEACQFIFMSALEMADGPKAPDSPSQPFQGGAAAAGVEETKSSGSVAGGERPDPASQAGDGPVEMLVVAHLGSGAVVCREVSWLEIARPGARIRSSPL